eukprot:CAMPEP_0182425490 /NCGR_PEP_ID=MMETSP1167-20130531/11932_1 /TAXON_ID=2988 /ORGANISM="Mallomonas Sp, Strain CCMP3275" /LENGTH=108 /DNA_ID=CAMNT_0024606261 /DNA_START=205 /DNA_END=531 /DNA_ORIENTATION=+
MVKNPKISCQFLTSVIGLQIKHEHKDSIELETDTGIPLILKEATNAAQLSVGYTPLLSFEVLNLDEAVMIAMREGGVLDGPVKYPVFGKFAALRTPDGLSLGLTELYE